MTARQLFYAPTGVLRSPWRIVVFLAIALVTVILVGAFAGRFWPAESFLAKQERDFATLLIALIVAHVIALRVIDRRPWSSVGLGAAQAAPRVLAAGLALGGLAILLPSGLLLLAHWLRPAPATLAEGSSTLFALQLALLFLPQSFAEELLSRGYVFAAIRESAGPRWAIALTALSFAALHLGNPGADSQSFALVLLAGIFLAAIVIVTGSLWAAWMAHFAWNFAILGLLHAPVSGVTIPAPGYTVIDSGPDWATGGVWGPEGGLAAALGMSAALAVLAYWRRRSRSAGPVEPLHG